MQILTFQGRTPNERHLAAATDALRDGEVIIMPTDTLYAIACDALNPRAIDKLCRIKGIDPERSLLSTVCSDIAQASRYARIDNRAFAVLKEDLPGPYTFILPASSKLPKAFKGRRTVGIRIPDCDIARELARRLDGPILTTSVEPTDGSPDAMDEITDPDALAFRYAGQVSMILDAGQGSPQPSTIIDMTDSANPVTVRE